MPMWHVPIRLVQSTDHPELSNDEILALALSFPGGGTSSSGTPWKPLGPRGFAHTVSLEAQTAQQAEETVTEVVMDAVDEQRFPGWSVADVGTAVPANG